MISRKEQVQFISTIQSQFSSKEFEWIAVKINQTALVENSKKFNIFFSLVSRFISDKVCEWNSDQKEALENIYPGFTLSNWNKQELARVQLMMSLPISVNKSIILSFFETAEIKEQVALYKGLYLLENAQEFTHQYTEGIRTNIADVFDAIAFGNPFAKAYLSEAEWNQLILKCFFMDRNISKVQGLDDGKNKDLATMLQEFVKERWAAGRQIPIEAWRMIEGYLREDVKELILKRTSTGVEKEILDTLIANKPLSPNYWNNNDK
ncbi:hypothetical protein FHR24_001995 [Wenyingzhuangia heitensis]|uniref:Uncharacterized protein n=1 Tax=Wenyingzhuangia heitensis TaxID=1487859 RepID=A0ABX0UES1_9FLAO|nr:EboA domain-containing protein [Wenyingzhuangia heitensis]NIJ45527.1 hypothetical protein [Wenyingzhuangia heitensis]